MTPFAATPVQSRHPDDADPRRDAGGPRAAPLAAMPMWVMALLLLSACSPSAPKPAAVTPPAAPIAAASTPSGATDASVPDASSVLSPAAPSQPGAAAGRPSDEMSPGQQSSAMPMPGQNNDHSSPTPPARRASGT